MSQAKLKTSEGRKEVRHISSCGELGLLGNDACRDDRMHVSLCNNCCPLTCSSLLHAELQAVGMLEAKP